MTATTQKANGNGSTRTRASTKQEMAALKASLNSTDVVDEKAKTAKKARQTKIEAETAEMTVQKVASDLARVSVVVSKSLSSITDELRIKVDELNSLNEAIQYKKEALDELHGKDIAANALDSLIAEYEEKAKQLEAEAAERRTIWLKEQAQHREEIAALNAKDLEERQRAHDAFEYDVERGKREALAKLEQEIHARKVEERDRREKSDRDIRIAMEAAQQRDLALQAREQQLIADQGKFASEKDAIVKEAEGKVHGKYNAEMRIMKLEFENKLQLAGQEIDHQKQALADASNRNLALQKEVADLQDKMQKMAVASIDASSDRKVSTAVMELADKQSGKK